MITPKLILELIKEVYNVDVSQKNKRSNVANLRSMYYYLCVKYCNPKTYTYDVISKEVNRKYSTIHNMLDKVSERLKTKGWEEYNEILINLDNIIQIKYSQKEDIITHRELDDFDTLRLKRRIKLLEQINTKHFITIRSLKNEIKKNNI